MQTGDNRVALIGAISFRAICVKALLPPGRIRLPETHLLSVRRQSTAMPLFRFPEARHLRKAMRKAGAVRPDTALTAREFTEILDSDIDSYVEVGMLREGAPRTFYLHEPTASIVIRKHTVIAVVFWLLLVTLVPIIQLYLANNRGP